MLQDALSHGKLKNCEICQTHAADRSQFGYCQNCPHCQKDSSSFSGDILLEITITSSKGSQSNAPKFLEVDLIGDLLEQKPETKGEYVRQNYLINRFPFWKKHDENFVIWFNNRNDHWILSLRKDIGTSNWIFASPFGNFKWPNEIDTQWMYHINGVNDERILVSKLSKSFNVFRSNQKCLKILIECILWPMHVS